MQLHSGQRVGSRVLAILATLVTWSSAAYSQETAYVRGMAATCTNCHSTEIRGVDGIPGIAGRNKSDLLQQLRDFKSGARPATVMHQLARGFSDEQLEQLAGYFAEHKPGSAGTRK
jgi:sulfide dehydrogenase cytochrome subunit